MPQKRLLTEEALRDAIRLKGEDAMVACFLSGAPCFDPATFGDQPAQEAS